MPWLAQCRTICTQYRLIRLAEGAHPVINDELVHAARAECGAHGIHDRDAGIDVADQLRLALARVRALPQQDDLRLLQGGRGRLVSISPLLVRINGMLHFSPWDPEGSRVISGSHTAQNDACTAAVPPSWSPPVRHRPEARCDGVRRPLFAGTFSDYHRCVCMLALKALIETNRSSAASANGACPYVKRITLIMHPSGLHANLPLVNPRLHSISGAQTKLLPGTSN